MGKKYKTSFVLIIFCDISRCLYFTFFHLKMPNCLNLNQARYFFFKFPSERFLKDSTWQKNEFCENWLSIFFHLMIKKFSFFLLFLARKRFFSFLDRKWVKDKFIFSTNRPNEKEKQNIIEREKSPFWQNRLEMFTKKFIFLQKTFFSFIHFLTECFEHFC